MRNTAYHLSLDGGRASVAQLCRHVHIFLYGFWKNMAASALPNDVPDCFFPTAASCNPAPCSILNEIITKYPGNEDLHKAMCTLMKNYGCHALPLVCADVPCPYTQNKHCADHLACSWFTTGEICFTCPNKPGIGPGSWSDFVECINACQGVCFGASACVKSCGDSCVNDYNGDHPPCIPFARGETCK